MWGLITLIFIGEIRPKSEMNKKDIMMCILKVLMSPPKKYQTFTFGF
jgi:hypothetical protein